jgi:hypothetical protein
MSPGATSTLCHNAAAPFAPMTVFHDVGSCQRTERTGLLVPADAYERPGTPTINGTASELVRRPP